MKIELGTIDIDVGDGEVELDLDTIIPIQDNLSAEFSEQPSMYAYIAMLAARAEACWLTGKRELENKRAQTDQEVRRDLASGGEKFTEAKVAAEIEMREGYRNVVQYELEVHMQHLIMRALEQTMAQRAQMLISLGAHLRAEAEQTGMLIRDVKAKLDMLRVHGKKAVVEVQNDLLGQEDHDAKAKLDEHRTRKAKAKVDHLGYEEEPPF